jgi:hypothetical protein
VHFIPFFKKKNKKKIKINKRKKMVGATSLDAQELAACLFFGG